MPVQQQVTVRRWTWCRGWLGIPYPCRKTYEEIWWCYSFWFAQRKCWGFFEQFQACEGGIEYHYWDRCFGLVPSWTVITDPYQKCFKDLLEEQGQCSISGEFPPPPTMT